MDDKIDIIWKPIILDGEPTQYEVSEYGNVRNTKTGNILIPVPLQKSGRLRVLIYRNGVRKDMKIHRLVYEAFYGPIPKDMTVDHIDENILNNHYTNLRLLTASENIKSFRNNHCDFLQVYTDETFDRYFKMLQKGVYHLDAAKACGINPSVSYGYLAGRKRRDLWLKYQPFPPGAYKRHVFTESMEKIAIASIIDGQSTSEIIKKLDMPYNEYSINKLYKLRRKLGIKDPRYFNEDFVDDIDRLIKDGKTNQDIYDILHIDFDDRISWLMSRRRKLYGIPNNNFTKGNAEELNIIREMIRDGYSNTEILGKIGKERNQYYINLFGKERKNFKAKQSSTSETIESVS